VTKTARSTQYADVDEPDRVPGSGLDAFDAIYEREFEYVWRSLGRLGVPPSDLADAVHEVFLVLYKRWDSVDPERPVRPWLFGVARRVAVAARRRQRETPMVVDPPAPVEENAGRDLLWVALGALDEDRRVVIILHDLEGHTGAEIAALLEVPVNTVHSRLRLARADLLVAVRRLQAAT
jgi:RNA polymerase sigma-70 factor (ECF subfamily)